MLAIDFTKPFLYKDVIYFNQGNLAANNILRCKLVTGGDKTLEGYIATVTFKTLSHTEINGTVNIVDVKNCIVDIKFPSNALEVGVNELEVILTKGEGIDKVVTPSPVIKYEVWQCITTGNGIQGDTNYPILIDLMSEVNNTVRIANNASATADASLKQTAKMLDVVNTNIAKANETIDNTNSAKEKALNVVEEVNTAKDNLISEVNVAKNAMIEDINSSKKSMLSDISTTKQNVITDTNKAIDKMNKDFEALTSKQQQDMEVIKARGKYDSLSQRFEGLDKDLLKAKELTATAITIESNFVTVEETSNGYFEDIKLEGKTSVNKINTNDIKILNEVYNYYEISNLTVGNEYTYVLPNLNDVENAVTNADATVFVLVYKLNNSEISRSFIATETTMRLYTRRPNGNTTPLPEENKKRMLLEGNYTQNPPSYFEGMKSVGDDVGEIVVTSVKGDENLIDTNSLFDKKRVLYYDTESQTWKKPILREWDTIEKHNNGKYYYNQRSEERVYQEGDESNPNVITNKTNSVYKLEQEKIYECTPIDLITFENQTNYIVESGALSPKTTIKVQNYIGNVINTLKEKVSNLEDKLYKTNLANFTVALNTLDTKLKLEQLTKTPR